MCDIRTFCDFPGPPESQRAGQKERTRVHIIDTALGLIRTAGDDIVTIRAVAAAAGVTERTVYRHFQNREALLRSVWKRMLELIGAPATPQTADALITGLRRLFPRLDKERELVRAYLHSEERRVGRTRFKPERQRALTSCVQEELEYLDAGSLHRRAAITSLIASSYAWQYMGEFWGLSGDEAAHAAAEAIEILLNRRLPY
jgi:AcrR family transcriptional regulator